MTRNPNNLFDWNAVDDVLLDMDGTLLDRRFDDFFFEEALPQRYAEKYGLALAEAQARLLAMYRSVEGTLDWADLHYWTERLGIDVVELTREHGHLICFLPGAVDFLRYARAAGKRVAVVTNAHYTNVSIKVGRTGLDQYVDRVVCAFDIGCLKLRSEFWPACQRVMGFDPAKSLYVDDDQACLAAARQYGVGFIFHSAKSSSSLPAEPSSQFPSVQGLCDLISD